MADMLIIGQGPAGVSASLYALRAGLDVILVGKGAGALEKAHMIENYYGLEKPLSGSELFEVAQGRSASDVVLTKALFASPDIVAVDTAAGKFFTGINNKL